MLQGFFAKKLLLFGNGCANMVYISSIVPSGRRRRPLERQYERVINNKRGKEEKNEEYFMGEEGLL